MISKIIKNIENQDISISQWLAGFVGIVFIRFILETLSSPTVSGLAPLDAPTLIQYGLSFLAILLGLTCIVKFFVRGNENLAKIALFGLPIIWLGPIVDIISSLGKGHTITYIFDDPKALFFDFLTFFGHQVTIGLRVELFIILFAIGWYVWSIRKNIKTAIFTVLTSYIFLFFIFAIPSIIFGLSHGTGEVVKFLSASIAESNIVHNTINATLLYKSGTRALELWFDKLLSQISFILGFIFATVWFWQTKKEKFVAIIKNSRPERVAFYLTLLALGMGFAYTNGYGKINLWIDWLSIITLVISWYGAWMFAVHTNDLADISIDKVSNPDRPITEKTVTEAEMSGSAHLWLIAALLGSWSVGYYPFFMNLVFTASYYIYSIPPLRLKRVPILSSFLISIACLSTVLAGFFFLSAEKNFQIFPSLLSIGILVVFTLGTNIRDIKDVEGDKKEGVRTLPVIFGNLGKKIVGIFFAISFLLVPIFLSFFTLYIIAIPVAIMGYRLVTKKRYEERKIFYLYFVFIIFSVILAGSLYWLKDVLLK